MKNMDLREKLCILSGEDTSIIFQTNNKLIINSFVTIGALVFLLFGLSLISTIMLTVNILKGELIIDLIIGLFWAITITNIYVFLLYTITPTIHPNKYKKGNKIILINAFKIDDVKKRIFTGGLGSFIFKSIFLVIVTFNISIPIFYSLNEENENRRFLEFINNSLDKNFWIISLFIFFLLLLPVILKYALRGLGTISRKESFYHRKQKLEKRIITKNYNVFKIRLAELLQKNDEYWIKRIQTKLEPYIQKIENFNPKKANELKSKMQNDLTPNFFEKHEVWADPPFNTIKKVQKIEFNNESELIESIYNTP